MGVKGTPAHNTWHLMLQRCMNPNATDYAHYGGRGITVCERWKSYANFLADMGARPEGLTLDRIDNDGNYEPGNCRWATATEQVHNSRSTKLTQSAVDWIRANRSVLTGRAMAAMLGISRAQVSRILTEKRWPVAAEQGGQ